MKRRYLIDTSSILTPYKTYYNPSIAPKFWEIFSDFIINSRKIFTIEKVIKEINKYHENDSICKWVNENFNRNNLVIYEQKEPKIIQYYSILMEWAERETQRGRFKSVARDEFAKDNNADPWIIATAKWLTDSGYDCIIITEENFEPKAKRKIFIPVAASEVFGIKCISLLELMKIEGIIIH